MTDPDPRFPAGARTGSGPSLGGPAGGAGSSLPDWLETRLLERRSVLLRDPLDSESATRLAALLMTLDATGDDPVHLEINCSRGSLPAALTLMDTILGMGVEVEARCSGRAEGPALGVLAVAQRREAAVHACLRLEDPPLQSTGSVVEVTWELEQHRRLVERFLELVAHACHQPAERLEVDLAQGRSFDAEAALAYGLIDGIWRRG
ncbi:MAG: ATP-dependent Clp protease proteolytic subunit [Candidatus Dormibacteria bacterium]